MDGVVVEKYLWENKTRLLATFDGNNNLKHSYEYTVGNTPTSYYAGNQRYYILTDQLGSPRIITDSAGNVLREIEYDSYGNIIADSNPSYELPFGFAGGLYDQHTGLIRFGFRDYDPETGRWTARDPIGFAGGDTNLYGYVLGDSVNFIDPTGLVQAAPRVNGSNPSTIKGGGGYPSVSGYSASSFTGRVSSPLKNYTNPNNPQPRNSPDVINGRPYSGHSLDRMQERGYTPSVIENAIRTGKQCPTNSTGSTMFLDSLDKLRVYTNSVNGTVITVKPGVK